MGYVIWFGEFWLASGGCENCVSGGQCTLISCLLRQQHSTMATVYSISHFPFVEVLEKPIVEILNSHWLNTFPSLLPICHKTILYNQNIFLYFIFSASTFTSSVTPKVKAVYSCDALEHVITAWCGNPKDDHKNSPSYMLKNVCVRSSTLDGKIQDHIDVCCVHVCVIRTRCVSCYGMDGL
jgi:hypothetical protein